VIAAEQTAWPEAIEREEILGGLREMPWR